MRNYYGKHHSIPEIIDKRITKFANDLAIPSQNKFLQKLRKIITNLRKRELKLHNKFRQSKFVSKQRRLKLCRHNLLHYIACRDYFIMQIKRKIKFLKQLRGQLSKIGEERFLIRIKTLRKLAESKLYALLVKRNNLIIDQRRKIANNLIEYCILHRTKNIIFGYKKGWKNSNLARKFNRHWRFLPIREIIDTIKYKANLMGIRVIFSSES